MPSNHGTCPKCLAATSITREDDGDTVTFPRRTVLMETCDGGCGWWRTVLGPVPDDRNDHEAAMVARGGRS